MQLDFIDMIATVVYLNGKPPSQSIPDITGIVTHHRYQNPYLLRMT